VGASSFEIDRVFILRFWRERSPENRMLAPWRARITEVNTGRRLHVGSVDDALDFVRNQLASPGNSSDRGGHAKS